MVLQNNKKHKILGNGTRDDKISNLPDELIHHVLSFLPIKSATSTCILSKRWKYLSNSMPILDFRESLKDVNSIYNVEERHLQTQKFMNFLDTVIYLHRKPNIIQKFYLSWDRFFEESRITKWIGIVIMHKVEQLFLTGRNGTSIFPLSFFTCDTLTVLELDWLELNVPKTVSFPKLKILRLRNMNLLDGVSANKLLSSCPILEELSLIRCSSQKCDICIQNIALKNLYFRSWIFSESTLKILAPNLTTISYGIHAPAEFVLDSFPSLVQADIDICSTAKTSVLIKLLEKLSSIKILRVSAGFFRVLSKVDMLPTDLPAFNNLIHLEVGTALDKPSSSSDYVSTMGMFFRFLQLSPNLESIVFAKKFYCYEEKDDGRWSLDPECSLIHLRSIKFNCFNGNPRELDAVKFFLKYAVVLETMTLVASRSLSLS